jgi:hypothetical protein
MFPVQVTSQFVRQPVRIPGIVRAKDCTGARVLKQNLLNGIHGAVINILHIQPIQSWAEKTIRGKACEGRVGFDTIEVYNIDRSK